LFDDFQKHKVFTNYLGPTENNVCFPFSDQGLHSSNNKTLNACLLARHKFVTGATLLQLRFTHL
jgi:hypothetical protein